MRLKIAWEFDVDESHKTALEQMSDIDGALYVGFPRAMATIGDPELLAVDGEPTQTNDGRDLG